MGRLSPLRRAFEAQDWPAVLDELRSRASQVDGCWVWPRIKDGYGIVTIARRQYFAHRISAAAARGAEVPPTQPVHHRCGLTTCINPDHLQVVTAIENTAEMLERHGYLRRIAVLEAALASLAPHHEALRTR